MTGVERGKAAETVNANTRPRSSHPIERASSADLMELAAESAGSAMQVAAVLVLGSGPPMEIGAVRDAIAERIRAVPRMRQRLIRTPVGCGRAIWVDDAGFDIRRHVHAADWPPPGDERALLERAADLVADPLPRDQPLWLATFVSGRGGSAGALIVVFHHALADGIGGLAVLARLVDGIPVTPPADFPRPPPATGRLCADALRTRLSMIAHIPAGIRQLLSARAELGADRRPSRAPRCSLNKPIGPRRALAVVRADLAAVRAAGRAHGATVNDVVLAAVVGALHQVLRRRGEDADHFVVSVPISARREASATQLGNEGGVLPVELPVDGDPPHRLAAIGRITRGRKTASPGASAAVLAPAFRAMARLGVFGWFIRRQRLVTTFVTNLRGPSVRLSFLGAPIESVIPVSMTAGNVTVAFAVLSYAGTLVITIISDPRTCPDLPVIEAQLSEELALLTASVPATL